MSATEAGAIVQARRGTMYDPLVVDAFRDLCASLAPADLVVAPAVSTLDRAEPVSRADDDEGMDVDEIRVAVSFGAALADASAGDGLRAIAQALRTLPDVDAVAVFVVDELQHRLIAHETAGGEAALLDRLTIPIGERVSGWVAATRQNIVNGDAALDLFDTDARSLRSAIAVSCGGSRAVITL